MKFRTLLHVCCAPCSIAIIDELTSEDDLTALFYNPNIFPADEYLKRKAEVIRVCRDWGVKMVDLDHEIEKWESMVGRFGPGKEGGPRCSACYRLRLDRAARYAKERGFDRFTSSLSFGRKKSSTVIIAIGKSLEVAYGVPFLDVDWKKSGRIEKGEKFVKDLGIYRQSYCGCRFSLEEARALVGRTVSIGHDGSFFGRRSMAGLNR